MQAETQVASDSRFTLKTEYSTPYSALIRDDVVMGVSRYFIERWLPLLGPRPATVVHTLRQLAYGHTDGKVVISGASLAREATMSRRNLYTCLNTQWMPVFLHWDSGRAQRTTSGQFLQQANCYWIRADDPLNPADADQLLDVLKRLADSPIDAASKAREIDARQLWAPDPKQSSTQFGTLHPITAHDVLRRAFPTWMPTGETEKRLFNQQAEALQRHVSLRREDGRASKIIVPQYFRRRWWKHLGHDLAWCYLWLRGEVYDNPIEKVRHDTCWIPSLNTLLALIGRPREWWRRNVENAQATNADWSVQTFFKQVESQKGRDPVHPQWVARKFTVAIDIAIAPEDKARYAQLLASWNGCPVTPSPENDHGAGGSHQAARATGRHTGGERVCHRETHQRREDPPQGDTLATAGSATEQHTEAQGVCHRASQASATLEPREKESKHQESKAQEESNHINSNRHPSRERSTGDDCKLRSLQSETNALSLIDQLSVCLEKAPNTPLFQAVSAKTWLEETWPQPVQPHTPAWNLTFKGEISARDLVALILSVWATPTIKYPPRYLSWLAQRWKAWPEIDPVPQWASWQSLAEMPLDKWVGEGRYEWMSLVSHDKRELPFGLDTLRLEWSEQDMVPEKLEEGKPKPFSTRDHGSESSGLNHHPGDGSLNVRDIWRAALGQLGLQLNRTTFAGTLEGAKPISYRDGILTVQTRHVMARDLLIEQLNHSVEAIVSSLAEQPIRVCYTVAPSLNIASDANKPAFSPSL
jgi:hypothetical protein